MKRKKPDTTLLWKQLEDVLYPRLGFSALDEGQADRETVWEYDVARPFEARIDVIRVEGP